MIKIYFSDFFDVSPATIEDYGAFNVSLINDLPLFIDPFLLFNSRKPEYQTLHYNIIRYLRFLHSKSSRGAVSDGLIKSWYVFGEVRQNWLGFARSGNSGTGLGLQFAHALHANLSQLFSDFGHESISYGSHLEKICLINEGVGRDNISDFTTNLIKGYLLGYTQDFARQHIRPDRIYRFPVGRVRFNYDTESWEQDFYDLPRLMDDYVLLTPKDILTKDDIWIGKNELYDRFISIADSVSDEELRAKINNYFAMHLPRRPRKSDYSSAISATLRAFPQVIDYYIRDKEENGDKAKDLSKQRVDDIEQRFVSQVAEFVEGRLASTGFYSVGRDTFEEARRRVLFLKQVIENNDGYKIFYKDGLPLTRENDVQILFRLTWFGSPSDVNREVNNGRGPVDFKVSRGDADKCLAEFKLASNSQLRKNLEHQVPVYEAANTTKKSIKVIVFFSQSELDKVNTILRDLQLTDSEHVVLIDARADNKPSASKTSAA